MVNATKKRGLRLKVCWDRYWPGRALSVHRWGSCRLASSQTQTRKADPGLSGRRRQLIDYHTRFFSGRLTRAPRVLNWSASGGRHSSPKSEHR